MYWLFTGSFKGWFPLWMNMRHGSNHSKVFCKKVVSRNFAKFTGKYLCQSFFLHKVVGLRPATLLKKRPWHRWFPVNFVKFLRTPFFKEDFWWLLLWIKYCISFLFFLTFSCLINKAVCVIMTFKYCNLGPLTLTSHCTKNEVFH